MKTIFYASPTRKEYFSPECDILNFKPEGLICSSSTDSINDWGDDGEFNFDSPSLPLFF